MTSPPSSTPLSIRIAGGKAQPVERAGRGQEAGRRILGIEPRFHRPAVDRQLILPLRQRLARSDAQLPLDEILPGDRLGHGMLDLKAGVHLHEPDAVGAQAFRGVGDELDRPRADIIDRLRRLHRRLADRGAGRLVHARRGRLLDHLLVAALQRAVALEQVDDVAVRVAEHLHLDMARAQDIFLDQHMVVAERGGRLALAAASSSAKSAAASTLRMPLPPPPATALISTG